MSLLELKGLDASYGPVQVLRGVDLSVAAGGITTLLGGNGAGKTTTLRAISNIMVRSRGEIRFEGRAIGGLAAETIARLGLAHVPDGRGTFSELTVEENLRLGAYARRDRGVGADMDAVFLQFPRLAERRTQQAGLLSGGEQQMLAIARALMLRPKLLLLDEPSFGLAPLVVREIFQSLEQINRERGVGILLVEQNAQFALAVADQAFVLETGRIVASGPAARLRADPAIRRAYLGV